jgi:hypothetical protein
LRILEKAFVEVSYYPTMLGLVDVASYDEKGQQVSNPQFPFRLVFQPLKDLKTMYEISSSFLL